MKRQHLALSIAIASTMALLTPVVEASNSEDKDKDDKEKLTLEHVIVTANKWEKSLQDIPVSVSVLNRQQLSLQGVGNLSDLMGGTIPSLSMAPFASSPSTLMIAIRGNGPGDGAQTTRSESVAIYLDDIYLGQAQGSNLELIELDRLEVLAGPQGTLFGRNATGGAISLISKRPTGEFGVRQTIGVGRYDKRSSMTHIDLPEWSGLRAKIDYVHSERDGWVENIAEDQPDYNAYKNKAGRISLDWSISEDLELAYSYNNNDTEVTQNYIQVYQDFLGLLGEERDRASKTRFAIGPLEPTKTEQQIHSLTAKWAITDSLSLQSLSSYRELEDRTRSNYGGALYFNGFIEEIDVDQDQLSQEFRLLGQIDRVEWVSGLYYYRENVDEVVRNLFSLDSFGLLTGILLQPINPPTDFNIFSPIQIPERAVTTEIESVAVYGQATWTPPVLNDQLDITLGLRHTRDKKDGARTKGGFAPIDIDEHSTDPLITFNYHWTDELHTYVKWSQAYRSGGVNSRSVNLEPFDKETVDTFEIGLKAEFWNQRARFNTALFSTDYEDMFIDVFDPSDFTVNETINAENKADVDGVEIQFVVIPMQGFTLGLNYTYLDGDIAPQPNPLSGCDTVANPDCNLESFLMTQTPKHAGSLSVDYQLPISNFGDVIAHIDVISTSQYHHWATGGVAHPDGYTLVNAKISLANIPLGSDGGDFTFSLWGKNLTDEEYVIWSFKAEGASTVHAFGDPRIAGVDMTYTF
jgi:iron complex outermembrane receptor protein